VEKVTIRKANRKSPVDERHRKNFLRIRPGASHRTVWCFLPSRLWRNCNRYDAKVL